MQHDGFIQYHDIDGKGFVSCKYRDEKLEPRTDSRLKNPTPSDLNSYQVYPVDYVAMIASKRIPAKHRGEFLVAFAQESTTAHLPSTIVDEISITRGREMNGEVSQSFAMLSPALFYCKDVVVENTLITSVLMGDNDDIHHVASAYWKAMGKFFLTQRTKYMLSLHALCVSNMVAYGFTYEEAAKFVGDAHTMSPDVLAVIYHVTRAYHHRALLMYFACRPGHHPAEVYQESSSTKYELFARYINTRKRCVDYGGDIFHHLVSTIMCSSGTIDPKGEWVRSLAADVESTATLYDNLVKCAAFIGVDNDVITSENITSIRHVFSVAFPEVTTWKGVTQRVAMMNTCDTVEEYINLTGITHSVPKNHIDCRSVPSYANADNIDSEKYAIDVWNVLLNSSPENIADFLKDNKDFVISYVENMASSAGKKALYDFVIMREIEKIFLLHRDMLDPLLVVHIFDLSHGNIKQFMRIIEFCITYRHMVMTSEISHKCDFDAVIAGDDDVESGANGCIINIVHTNESSQHAGLRYSDTIVELTTRFADMDTDDLPLSWVFPMMGLFQ